MFPPIEGFIITFFVGKARVGILSWVTFHPALIENRHDTETLQSKQQRSIKLAELKDIEKDLIKRGLIWDY